MQEAVVRRSKVRVGFAKLRSQIVDVIVVASTPIIVTTSNQDQTNPQMKVMLQMVRTICWSVCPSLDPIAMNQRKTTVIRAIFVKK